MSYKLFVGGLSWNANDDSLRDFFEQYGEVVNASVIKDREPGRSRGFGFVSYSSPEEAQAAADASNNVEFEGRQIRVNVVADQNGGGGRY